MPIFYRCDGCNKPIAGTTKDPIHQPGPRTLCQVCVKLSEPAKAPKTHDGRGAAAKARWDAMTPEQKAAKVAKMQAGRKEARQ
jgi:hypothetical protein